MNSIKKRKDGRYCKTKTINGKRYFIYAKTKKELDTKFKNFKPPKKENEIKKNITFYEFAKQWLNIYKSLQIEKSTYENYFYVIEKHLNINTPINKLNIIDLQNILNNLPTTRIKHLTYSIIKQIFAKAYQIDLIKKDYAVYLTLGKITHKKIESFTIEEQKIILNHLTLGDDFSDRILFYLVTGIRPNEIKHIEDIKQSDNEYFIHVAGTKTENANRWIKISKTIALHYKNKPKNFFIFDTKNFRERFQKEIKSWGIKYGTLYMLRHTFATNLFYLKVPDKARQMYMGHYSSKITNDVYTSFDPTIKATDIKNLYKNYYPDF